MEKREVFNVERVKKKGVQRGARDRDQRGQQRRRDLARPRVRLRRGERRRAASYRARLVRAPARPAAVVRAEGRGGPEGVRVGPVDVDRRRLVLGAAGDADVRLAAACDLSGHSELWLGHHRFDRDGAHRDAPNQPDADEVDGEDAFGAAPDEGNPGEVRRRSRETVTGDDGAVQGRGGKSTRRLLADAAAVAGIYWPLLVSAEFL